MASFAYVDSTEVLYGDLMICRENWGASFNYQVYA